MRQRTVPTVRLWPDEPHWTAVSFRHFDISRGVWRFWGKNCKFKVLVLNLKLLNFCYYLAQSTAHWCHLGRSCSRWDRCRGRRLAGPSFEWSTPTWCPHWGWSQSGRSGCPRSPERAPCPWTSWWWLVWKRGLIRKGVDKWLWVIKNTLFYHNLLITNCAALDPCLQAAVHRFSAEFSFKVGGDWWLLK